MPPTRTQELPAVKLEEAEVPPVIDKPVLEQHPKAGVRRAAFRVLHELANEDEAL